MIFLPTFAGARGGVALESLVGVARQLVGVAGGPAGTDGAHLAARTVGPLHEAALAGGGRGGALTMSLVFPSNLFL